MMIRWMDMCGMIRPLFKYRERNRQHNASNNKYSYNPMALHQLFAAPHGGLRSGLPCFACFPIAKDF